MRGQSAEEESSPARPPITARFDPGQHSHPTNATVLSLGDGQGVADAHGRREDGGRDLQEAARVAFSVATDDRPAVNPTAAPSAGSGRSSSSGDVAGKAAPTAQGNAASTMSSAPPASTTSSYEALFRMRLINIDHILAKPVPGFDRLSSPFAPSRKPLRHVPVLRLFGATPAGQRVCAHVHGIFPYLYVDYRGSLEPKAVLTYIDKLGRQLNGALAVSQSLALKDVHHFCGIVAINLVKGTKFYGYHAGWSYFLKIAFVNPRHSSRLMTMLQSGRIMSTRYTVYEGHIRYQLQFMLDYNLFGCAFVDFEDVLFRLPVPSAEDHAEMMTQPSIQSQLWNDQTIPEHCLPKPDLDALAAVDNARLPRSSFCTLELDVTSQSILNRRLLRPRPIHRDFGEAAHTKAHSQGNIEKLVPSLNGLWEEEAQRRRSAGFPTSVPTPHTLGDNRVDPENEQRGKWHDEERLYSLLDRKLQQDREALEQKNLGANAFLERHEMDRFVLTTFQSVEAFQLDHVHGARKRKPWRAPPATNKTTGSRSSHAHEPVSVIPNDRSRISDTDSTPSFDGDGQPRLSQERYEASKVYDFTGLNGPFSAPGPNGKAADDAVESIVIKEADGPLAQAEGEEAFESKADIAFFASQQFIEAVAHNERETTLPSLEGDPTAKEGADNEPDEDENFFDDQDEAGLTPTKRRLTATPSRGRGRLRGGRHPGEGAMWNPAPGSTPPSGQASSRTESPITGTFKRKDTDEDDPQSEFTRSTRRRTVTFEPTPSQEGREAALASDEEDAASVPPTPSKTRGRIADLVVEPAVEPSPPRVKLEVPWQPSSTFKTPQMASSTSMSMSTSPERRSEAASASQTQSVADQHGSTFVFSIPAPTRFEVLNSFAFFGLPSVEWRDPYFSDPKDVPALPKSYGGKQFRFQSVTLPFLREFRHDEAAELDQDVVSISQRNAKVSKRRAQVEAQPDPSSPLQARRERLNGIIGGPKAASRSLHSSARQRWQFGIAPPTRRSTQRCAEEENVLRKDERRRKQKLFQSQMAKPTPSSFGFKISQHPGVKHTNRDKQHLTVFVVEVHVCTRGHLLPDPEHDEIKSITYNFRSEGDENDLMPASRTGIIMLRPEHFHPHRLALPCDDVFVCDTELEVLMTLVEVVRELDPEILAGYEIHNSSWGYIIERSATHFEFNIVPELGRINEQTIGGELNSTGWDFATSSAVRVTGRHVLNIWRLMRGEMALNQYTFENVVYHLLHKRCPKYSYATLTEYHNSIHPEIFCRPLCYWLERIQLVQDMIESSDIVFRTAEFARVYGIDFFSVINRGSQFKVESVMLRIAKPESFVLPSPSVSQRDQQNAVECFPLVMEPQSAFYKGPLLVLDFQSLYPSLMIAYNICYSTCLGRVEAYKGTSKFGCSEYDPQLGALTLASDRLHVSPNGMIYVKPNVRKSLLAKMLSEILDTRVMVKSSMKTNKDDKAFQRLQNARQLSLKLLANVTYGYTTATWSGRMPCVEIADSIVQYGRETLENSIRTIHATSEWDAQVVYGDTDSLFVYLPGRSKAEAFKIGQEIADKITSLNPRPVKLKFEKVYLPCVLLAKKRYVGFKYESLGDKEAVFDAKGIETVRRDGHAALQRMLETCIRILFTSQDLSLVKDYCQQQWRKILEGRISIQDFIFAKEVRLGGYSEKGVPPPGAVVATRKLLADPRAEPQHAERVPYLISQGAPGAKLNDQAVPPEVMLEHPTIRINSMYYITRTIIPPLARIFNLLGADVATWFRDMPHALKRSDMPPGLFATSAGPSVGSTGFATASTGASHSASMTAAGPLAAIVKASVSDHFRQEVCMLCGYGSEQDICIDCRADPNTSMHTLGARLHLAEARQEAAARVCSMCASVAPGTDVPCVNIDCGVLYSRSTIRGEVDRARALLEQLELGWRRGREGHVHGDGGGNGKGSEGALVAQAWQW